MEGELGGEATALGRTIQLSGAPVTVIGVMPTGFWRQIEAWVPMVFTDEEMSASVHGEGAHE